MSFTAALLTMAVSSTAVVTPIETNWTEIGKSVPYASYRLGSDALGYELVRAEKVRVEASGELPGIAAREVLHLTYINKASKNVFEMLEAPSGGKVSVDKHMKWLIKNTPFGLEIDPTTTFVSRRVGSTDVCFLATLISEPSAKHLVDRLVKIEKKSS